MSNNSFPALELINARKYIEQALHAYVNKPVDKEQLVNVVAKLLSDSKIKAEVRIDKDDPDVLSLKKEMNIIDDPDIIHISLYVETPQVIKLDFAL